MCVIPNLVPFLIVFIFKRESKEVLVTRQRTQNIEHIVICLLWYDNNEIMRERV